MDLMEKLKAECKKNVNCKTCKFVTGNGRCSIQWPPDGWNIEAIRKALGGTSDKEEIVVPEKHKDNYINALKGTIYNNVLIKQNEIISCLEQIVKREK